MVKPKARSNNNEYAAMLKIQISITEPLRLDIVSQTSATITALLGHSGSGKTSLLRAIAGLSKSAGSITINGQEINGLACYQRPVALVQQKSQLFDHWSIAQHIQQVRKRAFNHCLDIDKLSVDLGVTPLLALHPQQLSGGQSQRVALLLALLREPKLLLLDESFGALDEQAKRSLFRPLKKALQKIGAQALLVSHQLRDCAALADDCWILEPAPHGLAAGIGYLGSIGAGIKHYQGDSDCSALLTAQRINYDPQSDLSQYELSGDELTAATKIFSRGRSPCLEGNNARLALYADDIGISLQPLDLSSFANVVSVKIIAIKRDDYGYLLTAELSRQQIYIHVTEGSLQRLNLSVDCSAYAIFKAGTVDVLSG
jgi:molybdate transport system ATP-binding protein